MPCESWPSVGETHKEYADSLARLMCDQCEIAEKEGWLDDLTPALKRWWGRHKKADQERREAKARERAERAKSIDDQIKRLQRERDQLT